MSPRPTRAEREGSHLALEAVRSATGAGFDLLSITRVPAVACTLRAGIRAEAFARSLRPGVAFSPPDPLHYHEGGAGPAVVLLNGWTASGLVWPARLIRSLERDHRVVRVDNRGSGWSRQARAAVHDRRSRRRRPADHRRPGPRPADGRRAVDGRDDRPGAGDALARPRGPARAARHPPARARRTPGRHRPSPRRCCRRRTRASRCGGSSATAGLRVAAPGFGAAHPELVEEMTAAIARRPTPRFAVLDQARAIAAWNGAHRLRPAEGTDDRRPRRARTRCCRSATGCASPS